MKKRFIANPEQVLVRFVILLLKMNSPVLNLPMEFRVLSVALFL